MRKFLKKTLAQCLAHRTCTKLLAILAISIISQWERVSVKYNKIIDVLEMGVALAKTVQNTCFSVKITHA